MKIPREHPHDPKQCGPFTALHQDIGACGSVLRSRQEIAHNAEYKPNMTTVLRKLRKCNSVEKKYLDFQLKIQKQNICRILRVIAKYIPSRSIGLGCALYRISTNDWADTMAAFGLADRDLRYGTSQSRRWPGRVR